MTEREFRTKESYAAEAVSRNVVAGFLKSVGFSDVKDQRKDFGSAVSQTVRATSPSGQQMAVRVRLCWRFRDGKGRNYSAAQLMARVKNSDWQGSIQSKVDRQRKEGITHLLLIQPDGKKIDIAALIPLDAVWPIWSAQRDISARLSTAGLLGRRTKNHAMNGRSPTIYVRDDRYEGAREVTDALWRYPGVVDLTKDSVPVVDSAVTDTALFGDPETNRLIERAAVDFVRSQYENAGWAVRSVEQDRCGYDLDCSRQGRSLHVEVKGVAGALQQFNLTAGEYKRAQSDGLFRLALVTSALTSPLLHEYSGTNMLKEFALKPIHYRVSRKESEEC